MEFFRLAALTWLPSLGPRELALLAPYAAEVSVPAGRRVLLDGPFAQELALVVGGRGIVRCAGEPVAEVGPGDTLGPLAPPRGPYPTATVTALSALRLVTFSTRDIGRLRHMEPDALQALIDACAPPAAGLAAPPAAALEHAAAA